MRILRRVAGDETYFLIADVDPAVEDAIRGMMYVQVEDGYGRAFPTGTPHLDRIYQNFERVAEQVVLQAARSIPVPWDRALHAVTEIVEDHDFDWWITGSAALAVRGMDIEPRDIDLVVGEADAAPLGLLLLDYLFEPVMPVEDWICNWFGRAFLHARVEWVGGVHDTVDQGALTDFGPAAAAQLETVVWQGKRVRVPPLDLQLDVSRRRGLAERVAIIEQWRS